MSWKLLFFLILSLATTATYAEKASRQSNLMLKGIVPVKVKVSLEPDQSGVLVPTLKSNAPALVNKTIKLKTTRSPASVSNDIQKIVIESN